MRRFLVILLFGILSGLACRAVIPAPLTPTAAPEATLAPPAATPTLPLLSPAPTAAPLPTQPPPASPTPLEPQAPTETAPPAPPDQDYAVRFHPDGPLYSGDQVSLEVIAPQEAQTDGLQVSVQVETAEGVPVGEAALGPAQFGRYGIGERLQATLLWAWNTSGLPAGGYELNFSVAPGGPAWTETVSLLPAEAAPNPQAAWAQAETDCCLVNYITGTDAERDLPRLLDEIDAQAADAERRLGADPNEPIEITLLPRVLGHGGFTTREIAVSYLDRNYASQNPAIVLHHEMVHWLDGRLGGDLRPTMLVEGLAVYLSGGHFKQEPLLVRAAALLPPGEGCAQSALPAAAPACGLDRYIPLRDLAERFYFSQHEIGYLEAGALIEYMVSTWGWESFNTFYRDIHPVPGGGQAEALEAGLQKHFQVSLADLEERFLAALRSQPLTQAWVEDVRLTVAYFDAVRRYQQVLDPSAYFLTAWLPDPVEMRKRQIVADYLRRPDAPENQAVETLLLAAETALDQGDTPRTASLLADVDGLLDAAERASAAR